MEDLVPIAPFLMVVLIVAIVYFFSSRNRREVLETVREAMRNGQTLDPDTIKALGMPEKKSGNNDLKSGLILIAIALAMVALGWVLDGNLPDRSDRPDLFQIMTGAAAFPGFIGLVLTGFGVARIGRKTSSGDGR